MRIILLLVLALAFLYAINIKLTEPLVIRSETPQKQSAYPDEFECWNDENWMDVEGCRQVRANKIINLAEIEEGRNKINLEQSEGVKSYPNKFTSSEYDFQLSYPAGWKFNRYEYEGIETISIYKPLQDKEKSPELIIGTGQAYSTSGALCANQGCDYEGGEIRFNNGFTTSITKGFLFVDNEKGNPADTDIDFYRFSLPAEDLLPNLKKDNYVYVTGSFFYEKDGNALLDILTTLK